MLAGLLLSIALVGSNVSGNEAVINAQEDIYIADDLGNEALNPDDMQDSDTSDTDDGQVVHMDNVSLDSISVGLDLACKLLLVACILLACMVGGGIASLFMYWFTK